MSQGSVSIQWWKTIKMLSSTQLPWQLLSCHYTIIKSFPCLTWKHIIMIKYNSEMSINAVPLMPHTLVPEIPAYSGSKLSIHFLAWSYMKKDHSVAKIIDSIPIDCEMKHLLTNHTKQTKCFQRNKKQIWSTHYILVYWTWNNVIYYQIHVHIYSQEWHVWHERTLRTVTETVW